PTKTSEIGSILFTVRAPVGYVGKNNIKSCIGRGVCSINSFFNNEFLYQYLLWIEDKWDSKSQGSTFSAINSQELKRTKIFNPFLEEQTKIANFLSAIDRQIEQVDKQIDKTKAFKKG